MCACSVSRYGGTASIFLQAAPQHWFTDTFCSRMTTRVWFRRERAFSSTFLCSAKTTKRFVTPVPTVACRRQRHGAAASKTRHATALCYPRSLSLPARLYFYGTLQTNLAPLPYACWRCLVPRRSNAHVSAAAEAQNRRELRFSIPLAAHSSQALRRRCSVFMLRTPRTKAKRVYAANMLPLPGFVAGRYRRLFSGSHLRAGDRNTMLNIRELLPARHHGVDFVLGCKTTI